jgi:membrane-associated phospholipid phosphatase
LDALMWPVLMLFVQGGVALLRLDCIGKGRLFSRPLWRFRLFAPLVGYTMILGTWTRMKQLLVLILFNFAAMPFVYLWNNVVFAAVVIALYLDDYFTGDDERWQRIKDRLRPKRALVTVGDAH